MATAVKHMERSHRKSRQDEQGRGWFFNQSSFMAKDRTAKKKTLKEMRANA